jgi:hypothetical protein
MREITMDYKKLKRDVTKGLTRMFDHLGDTYTLAEFQQEVFRRTGFVVKPDSDETQLTFHNGISVHSKNYTHEPTGLTFGVSGVWGKRIRSTVEFDGHYTERLMQQCVNTGNQIKRTLFYGKQGKTSYNSDASKGTGTNP